MPLFKKYQHEDIFFIHIPRTAGRSVVWFFKYNSWKIHFNDHREMIKVKDGVCGVPHIHYPYYNAVLGVEKTKKFTVVRNPFDRFVSMCGFLNDNQIKELLSIDSKELFTIFIKNLLKSTLWFRPQYEFVENNTLIWKFENCLHHGFNDWIQKKFKIKTKLPDTFFYVRDHYDEKKKINLNNKLKKFIKNFYKKDFEMFNYDKIF